MHACTPHLIKTSNTTSVMMMMMMTTTSTIAVPTATGRTDEPALKQSGTYILCINIFVFLQMSIGALISHNYLMKRLIQ